MSKFKKSVPVLAAMTSAPLFITMWTDQRAIPMAIGVGKTLRAGLKGSDRAHISKSLHALARSKRYRAAIAAGGQRFNLDMTPAGEISEEHRAKAKAPPA